jgi:hypothetical protein
MKEIICEQCDENFLAKRSTRRFCDECAKERKLNYIKAYQKTRQGKASKRKALHKYHLKRLYGLTEEEYEDIVIEQNNQCAICNTNLDDTTRVSVDHCHQTNIVRGVLCYNCNVGLGHFKDYPQRLQKAIEYLERNSHKKI